MKKEIRSFEQISSTEFTKIVEAATGIMLAGKYRAIVKGAHDIVCEWHVELNYRFTMYHSGRITFECFSDAERSWGAYPVYADAYVEKRNSLGYWLVTV